MGRNVREGLSAAVVLHRQDDDASGAYNVHTACAEARGACIRRTRRLQNVCRKAKNSGRKPNLHCLPDRSLVGCWEGLGGILREQDLALALALALGLGSWGQVAGTIGGRGSPPSGRSAHEPPT